MELKNYSEECLKCKCRTCKSTYELNNSSEACYTWCEEDCKGEDPLDFRPDKECYETLGIDYQVNFLNDEEGE